MRYLIAAIVCGPLSQMGVCHAEGAGGFMGDWRTVRHGAEVKIVDCGDGAPCGFLTAVSNDIRGGATHDERNKDPELRARPLHGLPILWGYEKAETGWRRGKLYNPETGQTFRSSLLVLSPDRLKVTGCLGPFCRTQIWTRIEKQQEETPQEARYDQS